ncbi:MAG: carbohydrate ABC transporter permease [Clostridia bacterium]|nr:carbohydrate ABC transporter permease [Clostridia bacterium]
MSAKHGIKMTRVDKAFTFFVYVFLTFCLLAVLYPLLYVVAASFSDPSAVATGKVWVWPVRPTLIAYQTVLGYRNIQTGFVNSFAYMFGSTALSLIGTIMAAYPLSRKEFVGRGVFTFVFAFTMYVGGGLIPTYLLISSLIMLDTYWVMVIPGMVSVWHVIMCRTYFQTTISDELYEAAEIDGCSDFWYLIRIILPLSMPILAVLGMYTAVGSWNGYFSAMIYLTSQEKYPLQITLRSILMLGRVEMTSIDDAEALQNMQALSTLLKYAVIVVASAPMMVIYVFVQKFFVKGVMIGSIKG